MNILITGACGLSSRSVARSLRMSDTFASSHFIGTDICENEFGLYEGQFHQIYKVPLAADEEYEAIMRFICEREHIDAAVIVPELEVLAWSKLQSMPPALLPPKQFCNIAISKCRLYETLSPHGLAPPYRIISREQFLNAETLPDMAFPLWIRDASDGTAGAKGSFLATSEKAMADWIRLWTGVHGDTESMMVSEYLPGKNIACCMLFVHGALLKAVCCERMGYFTPGITLSGVTGNTKKARIFRDQGIVDFCEKITRTIVQETNEEMQGVISFDLKEAKDGRLFVTEINIRHHAFASSLAAAGANMVEAHLLATLGRTQEIAVDGHSYIEMGYFIRDIDGLPVHVRSLKKGNIAETMITSPA